MLTRRSLLIGAGTALLLAALAVIAVRALRAPTQAAHEVPASEPPVACVANVPDGEIANLYALAWSGMRSAGQAIAHAQRASYAAKVLADSVSRASEALTAGKNSVEAASNLPKGSSARRTKIGEGLLLIFDQRNMALESASAARDEYTKELRAARDELSQLSIAVADLTKRANALQQSVAVCNLPGEQNELPATQAVDALLKRTDEAFNAVIAAYDLVPVLDQLTAAEADAKAVLR